MPFVTEELWANMAERPQHPLITALWPDPQAEVDAEAKAEVEWLIALISGIRSVRSEVGVPPGAKLDMQVYDWSETTKDRFEANTAAISRISRISDISLFADIGIGVEIDGQRIGDFAAYSKARKGAAQLIVNEATIIIPLEGVIDIAAEKSRLTKALEASRKEAKALEGRLSNPSFVERAKPEAVDKARADFAHHSAEAERLAAALERLG
jgi:valyl-tRNA synthetase